MYENSRKNIIKRHNTYNYKYKDKYVKSALKLYSYYLIHSNFDHITYWGKLQPYGYLYDHYYDFNGHPDKILTLEGMRKGVRRSKKLGCKMDRNMKKMYKRAKNN